MQHSSVSILQIDEYFKFDSYVNIVFEWMDSIYLNIFSFEMEKDLQFIFCLLSLVSESALICILWPAFWIEYNTFRCVFVEANFVGNNILILLPYLLNAERCSYQASGIWWTICLYSSRFCVKLKDRPLALLPLCVLVTIRLHSSWQYSQSRK